MDEEFFERGLDTYGTLFVRVNDLPVEVAPAMAAEVDAAAVAGDMETGLVPNGV